MSTVGICLLVFLLVACDLVIVWAIGRSIALNLKPLADAHPPVEPAPDAVTRRFQSFSFGIANFGSCIHVAADDGFLHLRPAWLARVLGVRPMSIPWDHIELRPPSRWGRSRRARIGSTSITGPAWCLSLAAPAEDSMDGARAATGRTGGSEIRA